MFKYVRRHFPSVLFLICQSFLPHLIAADWWHPRGAQVAGVAVILVVHLVVLAVGAVVVVLPREASLNALVHGSTFQSLFGHLALVVETLVHQLLVHLLVRLILSRTHHVSARGAASTVLLLRAATHFEVVMSAALRVRTLAIRRKVGSCCRPRLYIILLAKVFNLREHAEATLWWDQA